MVHPDQLHFKPLVKNGKVQTVLGYLLGGAKQPFYIRETWWLPDGDPLFIDITQNPDCQPKDPIVILSHGLCGSSHSDYLLRLTNLLYDQRFNILRVNLKGAGHNDTVYAKGLYTAGSSNDLMQVCRYAKKRWPHSPLFVVGYSLSGNILLKALGEHPNLMARLVDKAISVCPPADLAASSARINRWENRLFERYFVDLAIKRAIKRHQAFPDLGDLPDINKDDSLFTFDNLYTAPQAGFDSAETYYYLASALRYIDHIKVPTHILIALDDPFIDNTALLSKSLPIQ
jgi:predicted alpha/beta-fold hydrolase